MAGFDDGGVGAAGQRLLLEESHYQCGDTLAITILTPGMSSVAEPSTVDSSGFVIEYEDLNGNGMLDDVLIDVLGDGTIEVE